MVPLAARLLPGRPESAPGVHLHLRQRAHQLGQGVASTCSGMCLPEGSTALLCGCPLAVASTQPRGMKCPAHLTAAVIPQVAERYAAAK